MEISRKELYTELFEITVNFLNNPLELLELWNRDKETDNKDIVKFNKDLKTYINYRYSLFIGECNILILMILKQGQVHKNFVLDECIN
jgi:hypothetical protein